MNKDFDGWNGQKKALHQDSHRPSYREREIRWCRLGTNIGFEQDGGGSSRARPVLILKGFSKSVCLVVPLTSSTKANPYYVSVGEVGGRSASAIISQLRLIDTKRLDQLLHVLDRGRFDSIRETVKAML